MQTNLAIKNVEFNGATLRAAQDELGKIWVGVRWVCQGMGFDHERMKNERKKIQRDVVLNQGVKFYPLGNDSANSDVLCLDLDYLPLWLAKISITPTMQRENPELVQRLITYQIKAKDVLAAAFLKKKPEAIPALTPSYPEAIHIDLPKFPAIPNYHNNFDQLNEKIDDVIKQQQVLYEGMGKLVSILVQSGNIPAQKHKIENKPSDKKSSISKEESGILAWKKELNDQIDKLAYYGKFETRNAALKMMCDYVNETYGICWDQQKKEYKEKYKTISKPTIFDVLYDDQQLRSIFMASLSDKIDYYKNLYMDETDKLIEPFLRIFQDTTKHHIVAYKRVYKKMKEIDPNINWTTLESRHIAKYGSKAGQKPTKKMIINKNEKLLAKFKRAVDCLIIEG